MGHENSGTTVEEVITSKILLVTDISSVLHSQKSRVGSGTMSSVGCRIKMVCKMSK